MRTLAEREEARREIMQGVNDHDTTIVEAIMELCRHIDDASQTMAAAHRATCAAIERLSGRRFDEG